MARGNNGGYDAEKDARVELLGTKMFGDKEKGFKLIVEIKSYDGGAPKTSITKRFYPSKRESNAGRLTMEETLAVADILSSDEARKTLKGLQRKEDSKPASKGRSSKDSEEGTGKKRVPSSEEDRKPSALSKRLRDRANHDSEE